MTEHDITKALEIWTLQNLFNISIMLGLLACGLAMIQNYYRALEKHLSLRVSIELWRVATVLLVDVLLALVVVVGYVVLNPDIMADIKIAVPFCPLATILFAAALCLRLFHGGQHVASKNYLRALYLMLAANALNVVGFTFVMEAASGEYLELHPSPFWQYLKTHWRSNASPDGLELAQVTFWICFPLLLIVLAWGVWSAVRQLADKQGE
jgi:hypothetical protein